MEIPQQLKLQKPIKVTIPIQRSKPSTVTNNQSLMMHQENHASLVTHNLDPTVQLSSVWSFRLGLRLMIGVSRSTKKNHASLVTHNLDPTIQLCQVFEVLV